MRSKPKALFISSVFCLLSDHIKDGDPDRNVVFDFLLGVVR